LGHEKLPENAVFNFSGSTLRDRLGSRRAEMQNERKELPDERQQGM
jgi:hypothetical protein